MAASRRPDPSRAAARASARAAARRAAGTTGARAPRPAGKPAGTGGREPRGAAALTTRAAVLGLVFCALVVSAALPLREYLAQRGEIRRIEQQQSLQRERVEALEAAKRQLQDPAYVTAEARRRLHFVLPGETAYVLVAPEPGQAPLGATAEQLAEAAGPESPWYSQLWSSVEAADEVAPADGSAAVPEPVPGG